MATNNQRLTAYITPENWERLQSYATEQGFCDDNGKVNQSPLVNSILNSFFSSITPSITLAVKNDTRSNTPLISSDTLKDTKTGLRDEIIGEVKEMLATYQDEISKKLTA